VKKVNKGVQNGYWDTDTDYVSSVNQDLAEMLETCLAEVKHKGEHPDP
jgi:hypothetical protein